MSVDFVYNASILRMASMYLYFSYYKSFKGFANKLQKTDLRIFRQFLFDTRIMVFLPRKRCNNCMKINCLTYALQIYFRQLTNCILRRRKRNKKAFHIFLLFFATHSQLLNFQVLY